MAALLRGDQTRWHDGWTQEDAIAQIRFHGVALALIDSEADLSTWPTDLTELIREEARLQALWEQSHKQLLGRVLDAFAKADIDCRVIKGTAVAYLAYDEPAHRRRGDSDLLVRPPQQQGAKDVLLQQGLVLHEQETFGQQTWLFDTGVGFVHAIDLHSRLVGSPYLCRQLDEASYWIDPVSLPRLSRDARTVRMELLLLRGFVNQSLHEAYGYMQDDDRIFDGERLIWMMDVALLTRRFSTEDWSALVDASLERGMAGPCLANLRRTMKLLGIEIPAGVAAKLESGPSSSGFTRYIGEAGLAERIRLDAQSLPSWKERAQWIWRQAFPTEITIRRRFPEDARSPLALLHLKRLAGLSRVSR